MRENSELNLVMYLVRNRKHIQSSQLISKLSTDQFRRILQDFSSHFLNLINLAQNYFQLRR